MNVDEILASVKYTNIESEQQIAETTYNGKTPLVFIKEGVKINQELCKTQILQQKLVPWTVQQFGNQGFTF